MEQPKFNGSSVAGNEWLDNDTFVVWFKDHNGEIKDSEGNIIKTMNSPYAEVHVDENNAVVLGENIFEVDNEGNPTDYIGTDYYLVGERKVVNEDGFELDKPYKLENGAEIIQYALEQMKDNE